MIIMGMIISDPRNVMKESAVIRTRLSEKMFTNVSRLVSILLFPNVISVFTQDLKADIKIVNIHVLKTYVQYILLYRHLG